MATSLFQYDSALYDLPDRNDSEEEKLTYCLDAIASGLSFLNQQPAYPDIAKGRAIVHAMETYEEAISEKLSHVRLPRIKRQIREIVSTLSNIRPTWDYISNNPRIYESQSNTLNKLHKAWYFSQEVDRSIRKALQFAAAEGTGYLYLTYEDPLRLKGQIKLYAGGALDFIPFQPGSDNEVQNCEAGIWHTELPVGKARRIYRNDDIQPTNENNTNLLGKAWGFIRNYGSVYLNAADNRRTNRDKTNRKHPTVDIYHLYIHDDTINDTGKPIRIGEHNDDGSPRTNNYSYTVPYLGQPIPTGLRKIKTDSANRPLLDPVTYEEVYEDVTRPATARDCLLYPNLRLMICTPDLLLYDGPSPWWHAQIPVIQFRFDDWPWNFLGFSLIRDTWRMEESINGRLRARDDAVNARLNPAIMFDQRMSQNFNEETTPRIPGLRVVKPPLAEKPVELLVPINTYDVPGGVDAEIQQDEERIDYMIGIPAIKDLLKLKQMPQSDSLDKVLGASGSIIVDIARNMEASIRELGEMTKVMFFQFCTAPERMLTLGMDGITPEDFDFDPGNMIPSHLPGEDPTQPSRATREERARLHVDSFHFNVVPNSLAQISAITRKMIYLQLWRDKTYPMDPWTFSDVMEISNLGPPPEGAKNQLERWVAWMKLLNELMPQQPQGAGGRPPTGHNPPHMASKNGGARQTVAESR